MNKIKYNIIFVCFIICTACKQRTVNPVYSIKEFTFNDLPKEIKLSGKKINLKEVLNPRHILALENYLVVAQNGLEDLFYIYRLEDLSFYRTMGANGLGPNEITMCNSLFPGKEKGEFWAYDSNMKQFAGYKIDQDKSQSYRQFKQPEKLLPAIELVDASDTTFMTRLGVGDDMFVEFSATQDTINKYGKWKWLIDNDHHDYFNTKLLQGRLNSSIDKNWFAISGIAKDYIELLDKKTGKIVSIRGPLNENPEYSIEVVSGHSMPIFNNKLKTKYPQTFLGEKSIFALFFGKPNFEVFGNKYAQINIFEFDFEGNPINNFVINFPVLSFTVNEDLRKIYGISLDNEPNIIEFNY